PAGDGAPRAGGEGPPRGPAARGRAPRVRAAGALRSEVSGAAAPCDRWRMTHADFSPGGTTAAAEEPARPAAPRAGRRGVGQPTPAPGRSRQTSANPDGPPTGGVSVSSVISVNGGAAALASATGSSVGSVNSVNTILGRSFVTAAGV